MRRLTRTGVIVTSAVAVAGVVTVASDAALELDPGIGFYGYFWGAVAGLLTLGVLLALGGRAARTVGLLLLASTLLVLGALVLTWAIAWGAPALSSAEGRWMWPLALASLLGGLVAGHRALHRDRGRR